MNRKPDRTNIRGMWGLNHRNQNDYASDKRVDCEEELNQGRENVVFRCGLDDGDNAHRFELEAYMYSYGDNWQRTLS